MKKIILFIAIILGIGLGGMVASTPTVTRTAVLAFQAKPKELSIPSIGVQAPVEYVGNDSKGAMDVPKNMDDVAWYKLGVLPGKKGSAVIAGHLDTKTGPAVFARISDLNVGDEVQVIDEKGVKSTFVVEKTAIYNDADFPIQEVFGASDVPRLNLITCTGVFNKSAKEYNKRLVIYTVLKNS